MVVNEKISGSINTVNDEYICLKNNTTQLYPVLERRPSYVGISPLYFSMTVLDVLE